MRIHHSCPWDFTEKYKQKGDQLATPNQGTVSISHCVVLVHTLVAWILLCDDDDDDGRSVVSFFHGKILILTQDIMYIFAFCWRFPHIYVAAQYISSSCCCCWSGWWWRNKIFPFLFRLLLQSVKLGRVWNFWENVWGAKRQGKLVKVERGQRTLYQYCIRYHTEPAEKFLFEKNSEEEKMRCVGKFCTYLRR